MEKVDIAVIGGGPAGLTAGIYGARSRLSTVVFDKGLPGGQVLTTNHVENYPGFPDGISGTGLAEAFEQQARNAGADVRHLVSIDSMGLGDERKVLITSDGEIEAKAVIIATGASYRKLGAPGEQQYGGRGVSYCATCDGAFFREKRVAVIGGGDTALEDAMYLSRIAAQVTIVHRRDKLRATKILQERAEAASNIDFAWNSQVTAFTGDEMLTGVELKTPEGARVIPVDGAFVAVGYIPCNDALPANIQMENGYVVTDENLMTSVAGVFAAGDIRKNVLKQISVAVGEGAVATTAAIRYLEDAGLV